MRMDTSQALVEYLSFDWRASKYLGPWSLRRLARCIGLGGGNTDASDQIPRRSLIHGASVLHG